MLNRQPRLAFLPDSSGRTPLHYAAELGDVAFMQRLLNMFATHRNKVEIQSYIDARSFKGETGLMLAAAQGNNEAAEWLISNHADVNATAANGYTALDDAAEAGYSQLAELLVAHKANTNKAKVFQQLRLRNMKKAQTQLASLKDDPSPSDSKKHLMDTAGLTSFQQAALQGDVKAIKTALKEGVDVEEYSSDGETPLMLAASKGYHEAIQVLLSSGANINATSTKGWTTLMNAVRKKDARTVNQLIANGADVNHLSPDRWTALAEAAYQGQKEIMKMLLKCGADTESRSSHDWTPLMHASYKGDDEAVELLLDADANMEVASGHDETAILLAAAGGYTRIVQILLRAGCAPEPPWAKDRNSSSNEGAQKTQSEIVEGTEDRAHAQGWTPLMVASQGGHDDIIQILSDFNVNLEVRSPHDKTALEIAQENGKMETAALLDIISRGRG